MIIKIDSGRIKRSRCESYRVLRIVTAFIISKLKNNRKTLSTFDVKGRQFFVARRRIINGL